ncbi:MAG: aldehyde dehydrogenase family protein, partial [Anaerovoracaceae bacterium]
MKTTLEIMRSAKSAVPAVSAAPSEQKNQALRMMADCLQDFSEEILKENALDVEEARGTVSDVMIDRLALTSARIDAMADGIRDVAKLPDPVGRVLERIERPNGLVIEKTAVPLGVIAIIYESRPNVTSDAAALALKSGNAGILRAGRQSRRSAAAICRALQE